VPLTTPPKAVHDPFKSGWDDTIKSAESLTKQTSFKSKAKMTPLRIPPPVLRFPSPTCSDSSAEEDVDTSFAVSTQNYLLSPTGKEALGRVGVILLSPMSQSAVDLDVHAESQQLIQKPTVSKVETMKIGKHFRPPSLSIPSTPETFTSFVPLPEPAVPHDRSRSPVEPPVERVVRSSKSRENLSISAWPRPPTVIPRGSSPSPTRSPSRGMTTPSPTFCPSPNLHNEFVRQPSPTFPKATITDRDRAYIFGTPSLPNITPPSPPPRVSHPFQTQGTPQVGNIPGLKEVKASRSPALVPAKWGNGGPQLSQPSATGGNADANVVSPSTSSFIDSPSIYSTYSGNQPHPAEIMYTATVKGAI